MTTFDKREQGFENEFVHNKELQFKAAARCNMRLGYWAAAQLGLTGDAAAAYAAEIVTTGVDHQHDAVLLKLAKDLDRTGVSQQAIETKMGELRRAALEEVRTEG